MKGALQNKVVIITGASSGIGAATAVKLAQEGATVVITARNLRGLDAVAQAIRNSKGKVMSIKVDVQNENDIKDMISIVKNKFGKIDAIINNAGVFYTGTVDELDTKELDETLNVNLRGLMLCCKYAAKVMKKQRFGHIINISSGSGRAARPNLSAYSASKFGVMGVTESLVQELTPYNIKVSALCPGMTNTPMQTEGTKAYLKKLVQPEQIADLALYILTIGENANITEVHLRPLHF